MSIDYYTLHPSSKFPSGKTKDFIDHVIGGQVDLCAVTETFLTEHNNVTHAALHPSGYAFKDQP